MEFSVLSVDQLIVCGYLVLMLIVGLWASKGIKTMKDYAIADGSYPSIVVTLTLMATIFGGTSTLGVSEGIHADGIIMTAVSICFSLPYLFVAYFIAPNMGRFYGMISIGDIMDSFYGKFGRVLVGVMGTILGVGALAAQVLAAGYLINSTFGIPSYHAILVSAAILIIYSAFGGIKAVTITDIIQFIILIVVVPLISYIAVTHIGGFAKMMTLIPDEKLTIIDNPQFTKYLVMFLVWSAFPSFVLSPPSIQRMLMARDSNKIKSMYQISALTMVVFEFMVCFIAFAAIILFPGIDSGLALPSIINETLPPVFKGLAVAGILAVIMSSADSFLNSGAILLVHDILKPLSKSKKLPELQITKIVTFIIGILATIIAVNFKSVMGISTYAIALWGPIITIPLSSAIIGFRSCPKAFLYSSVITISVYVSAMIFLAPENKLFAPLFTIATNAITFFYFSYRMREIIKSEPKSLKEGLIKRAQTFVNKISQFSLIKSLDETIKKTGANQTAFAIFCLINYIAPYFMWTSSEVQSFEFIISIRLLCGALCAGILLEQIWPQKIKKYFGMYWYFTLMFCLPITTTIMVFTQTLTTEWMINMCLSIFLLASLVSWSAFISILVFGFIIGYAACMLALDITSFQKTLDIEDVYMIVYILIFSSLIGVVFTRKREVKVEERVDYFQGMSGMLAHELKNPLSGISGMMNIHKSILNDFTPSKDNKNISISLDSADFEMLQQIPDHVEKSIEKGRGVINTFFTEIKDENADDFKEKILISRCLNMALENFHTFKKHAGEIEINIKEDFEVICSKKMVMHMFLNILTNINDHAGKDAKIIIDVANEKVVIRDEGIGIPKATIEKIFDKNFSAGNSSGLGLDFCAKVMKDLGGEILCRSEINKFTEFEMSFRK